MDQPTAQVNNRYVINDCSLYFVLSKTFTWNRAYLRLGGRFVYAVNETQYDVHVRGKGDPF